MCGGVGGVGGGGGGGGGIQSIGTIRPAETTATTGISVSAFAYASTLSGMRGVCKQMLADPQISVYAMRNG